MLAHGDEGISSKPLGVGAYACSFEVVIDFLSFKGPFSSTSFFVGIFPFFGISGSFGEESEVLFGIGVDGTTVV